MTPEGSGAMNHQATTYRIFDWVNRHARIVLVAALLGALTLGVVGPMIADTDEPSFDPSGEVFDTYAAASETLKSESTIAGEAFLIESADGGDVLTAAALSEWLEASQRVRTADAGAHLVDRHDPDLDATIPGIVSIADIVDAELPNGLAAASDVEVKQVLAHVLEPRAPTSSFRGTLSEQATFANGVWTAPAFTAQVVYDWSTFESEAATEQWLREVQAEVQRDAVATAPIGIAIDDELSFEEATTASAPFIFIAVALIVLLIAVVHRSYWSSTVVAIGLGATTLTYYGVSALIGLKMGSMLLSFVVPIAMISFGVDFYIHGVGRVRESQVDDGLDHHRAYPAGMASVFTAMFLAAGSSIAAFLSNATSGTEAIVEFGVGSAIAIGSAYVFLGHIAPRALMALEIFVGPNPHLSWSKPVYWVGQAVAAVIAGLAVALAAVMPAMGTAAVALLVVILAVVPALRTRRRNRRASHRGRPTRPAIRGAAHGLRPVGSVVAGLARYRAVTLPIVVAIGAVGLVTALNVRSGFEINDFLPSNTDFVQSIEKATTHFPSSGEGSSFIFVEGDLTDPNALVALDTAVAELDASDAAFGRDPDGDLIVGLHAGDLARMTMASPAAVDAVGAAGTALTDVNRDGLPDSADQVRAVYDYIGLNGVPTPDGDVAISPMDLPSILADDGTTQATLIRIQVGSFTDGAIIEPVWEAMNASAANLEDAADVTAAPSGDVLTSFESLEAFTGSMVVSVPLALALTFLLAAVVLRSFRYAFAAIVPIGFVLIGIYAFMYTAGYTINVVTATIAAIAVGVGIDFSTHFTARYREELNGHGHRLSALRRAGEGTGGALVLSAMTSILGFAVMALAPTPIFSTFGALTAVMIGLSLIVSLVVLPSVLMLVTPRRVEQTRLRPAYAT